MLTIARRVSSSLMKHQAGLSYSVHCLRYGSLQSAQQLLSATIGPHGHCGSRTACATTYPSSTTQGHNHSSNKEKRHATVLTYTSIGLFLILRHATTHEWKQVKDWMAQEQHAAHAPNQLRTTTAQRTRLQVVATSLWNKGNEKYNRTNGLILST